MSTRRLSALAGLQLSWASVLMVAGCSTYQGQKLGTTADQKVISPTGVPYMLVRPEYALSRTVPAEGDKKPTYTVAVAYVTDPSQMYTLRINPGAFANADFVVKLGTTGAMQGTTTTLTETVTPAITALGSFAKDLIGAGVFDKDSVRNAIRDATTGQGSASVCAQPSDVRGPRIPPPTNDPSASSAKVQTTAEVINARATDFKDDEQFASLFHYVTQREQACLREALDALRAATETTAEASQEKLRKALLQYQTAHPSAVEDLAFIDSVKKAAKNDDTKAFAELTKGIKLLGATNLALAKERDVVVAAAKVAAKSGRQSEAVTKLDFFVTMDQTTWIGRHVLYLERELAKLDVIRLKRPKLSQDPRLAADYVRLQAERARALSMSAQYERSLILSDFLRIIPKSTLHGGTVPAVSEYVAARVELDAVLAQIDARRTRVLGDAKPPPAPAVTPLSGVPIIRVAQTYIDDSLKPGWIDGGGKEAPDYVLVLKELQ